jgi:hypothetical protein
MKKKISFGTRNRYSYHLTFTCALLFLAHRRGSNLYLQGSFLTMSWYDSGECKTNTIPNLISPDVHFDILCLFSDAQVENVGNPKNCENRKRAEKSKQSSKKLCQIRRRTELCMRDMATWPIVIFIVWRLLHIEIWPFLSNLWYC